MFAEVVADGRLAEDIRALARHVNIDAEQLGAAVAFAQGEDAALAADLSVGADLSGSALILARAASYSPARIDRTTHDACREAGLPAVAIIELITWLAVLQMLHRLTCYTHAVQP